MVYTKYILVDIFTLAGSPHKRACNCKRIWARTGLDINYATVWEPKSLFNGMGRINFKIVVIQVSVSFSILE